MPDLIALMKDYKTVGFIPDCHIPFEDQDAYLTMLKVFWHLDETRGLDQIVILGDYIDVYGMSFYDKDPSFGDVAQLFDREIECGNARLDELDKMFPDALKVYIEGNHEFRMTKHLSKFSPALRNHVSLVDMLRLNKRPNWRWHPYNAIQGVQILGSPLWARHEPYSHSSLKNNAKLAGESFIFGHIHHLASDYVTRKISGERIHAIAGGFLGDMESRVFSYVRSRPDWDLGFAVAYVNEEEFDYQLIRINQKNKTCLFDGKLFE